MEADQGPAGEVVKGGKARVGRWVEREQGQAGEVWQREGKGEVAPTPC